MSLVTISVLFEYAGDVVLKYIKDEKVYAAKYIIYCGMTRYNDNVVEIMFAKIGFVWDTS